MKKLLLLVAMSMMVLSSCETGPSCAERGGETETEWQYTYACWGISMDGTNNVCGMKYAPVTKCVIP